MKLRSCLLLCVSLLPWRAAFADYTVSQTMVVPGIKHLTYVDPAVPLRAHVIQADISSQQIRLYATQSEERGQTVTEFAQCKKQLAGCLRSDVAINGDLFAPLGYVPAGLAVGAGHLWPDANSDNAVEAFFAFTRPTCDVNAVYLSPTAAVEMPHFRDPTGQAAQCMSALSAPAEGVVGGRALLVQAGVPRASFDSADPTHPLRAGPRSALGLESALHTLYLVVVDGDQTASVGMTAAELGRFLVSVGVSDAIELDSGGSSALYVAKEGGVVSSPSDGVERPVANHLGLHFGPTALMSVVGEVFDSQLNGTKLTSASVVVDGIPVTNWQNGHTLYQVNNIPPHFVCAHATAPGFRSATQCRQITLSDIQATGTLQYLSLVLQPGVDQPDLATPTDLALGNDLAGFPDLGHSDDAGGGLEPPHGAPSSCSCHVGGRTIPSDGGLIRAIMVLLGGAMAYRRLRLSYRRSNRTAA